MNLLNIGSATRTWLLLLILTIGGFFAAEYGSMSIISVAVIMILSAIKIRLVLYRFMSLGDTPIELRVFFNVWLAACTLMILGLYISAVGLH